MFECNLITASLSVIRIFLFICKLITYGVYPCKALAGFAAAASGVGSRAKAAAAAAAAGKAALARPLCMATPRRAAA